MSCVDAPRFAADANVSLTLDATRALVEPAAPQDRGPRPERADRIHDGEKPDRAVHRGQMQDRSTANREELGRDKRSSCAVYSNRPRDERIGLDAMAEQRDPHVREHPVAHLDERERNKSEIAQAAARSIGARE